MSESRQDDFYVGYLPLPRAHRLFVRRIAPTILWFMVLVCGLTLWQMDPPARALWETGRLLELRGVVRREPYPLVEVTGLDGKTEIVLLTGIGKHGADVAAAFDGGICMVRGYPLERDGRRVLELMEGHEALIRLADASAAAPAPEVLGPVVFHGEILDSKCWHGAMKPGEGRAHKACATLCVRGGIPPMLIARDPAGGPSQTFLLTTADGRGAAAQVLPFLGEAVTVRGVLRRRADMLWLALDADGVQPEAD